MKTQSEVYCMTQSSCQVSLFIFRNIFSSDLIKSVKVEWSSVTSNEIRQVVLPPDQSLVSLTTFGHGVTHFIKFFGLE